MKVDGGIGSLGGAAVQAAQLEAQGYDGAFSAEIDHDPFLPLALAAGTTSHIELGTGIAVAFARSPMTVANIGYDLQLLSQGRFILGLGSQIQPHITKRFSMPWSQPAARMREFILAVRAIWSSWNEGVPLRFKGEFYRHTLMTPMFDPGPNPFGTPKVFLAAVGPVMTEVAGEVADGLVAHAFTTPSYFRDVTDPAIARGLARGGRSRAGFEVTIPVFIVAGRDDRELADRARATRQQLAFYGSTPAYKPVLEHHGWGSLSEQLNAASKRGEWEQMAELITDEVLHEFAVVGPPESIAPQIQARYGGLIDRLMFFGVNADTEATAAVSAALRQI